jgi:hypothetical protein
MLRFTQLLMHTAEIVGTPNQIHARLKSPKTMSRMTRFACQTGQSLPEGGIEALDKGGIEDRSSLRALQQLLGLLQRAVSHLPRDLNNPLFPRVLDNCSNVQLLPDLQTSSAHSRSQLDFLPERSADAARIGIPAIGQDEQRPQAESTSTNLLEQRIGQTAIPRHLDGSCHPQACRNHHRQSHPGHHFVSFHANFIGLYMDQIQLSLLNERLMDPLALIPCSISPIRYCPFIQAISMDDGLNWAPIRQEGDHNHDQLRGFAQAKEHGSLPGTEGLSTDPTAIAASGSIMNANVALSNLASCRAVQIRAKLVGRLHWLFCVVLHRHIMPMGLDFFKSLSLHRIVGLYPAVPPTLY